MPDHQFTTAVQHPLVQHAVRELAIAGMYSEDADYGPSLAENIIALVGLFATWGHSGGSAARTIDILERLLRWKTLTPVTSDSAEWLEHGDGTWQNIRCPSTFSKDGGVTWYDLEAEGEKAGQKAAPPAYLDIVFDRPPNGHDTTDCEGTHFIEVEDPNRVSLLAGEWIERGDGTWALRIPYAKVKLQS